jgi:hypothetical protein
VNDTEMIERILARFKDDASIGPPATLAEIRRAEESLGRALPAFLREFYMRCSFLIRETGDYLLPLEPSKTSRTHSTLVSDNLFIHDCHAGAHVAPFVFFGGSVRPVYFGMNWEGPPEFVEFFGYMECPQPLGTNLYQILAKDVEQYEEDIRSFRRRSMP